MGFVVGTLKGDIIVFGGECMGSQTNKQTARQDYDTHACTVTIDKDGNSETEQYIEGKFATKTYFLSNFLSNEILAFSILRMNRAGFIFGRSLAGQVDGFAPGYAKHGEASVSQAFSKLNSNPDFYK